ncbi:hypothetical protein CPBF426_08570 [Xanthomonas arboricola pv. juglandis]|nr:hypothetical protein CPBF426_08570 [Xanthomonas arboricola pv. juglandis]
MLLCACRLRAAPPELPNDPRISRAAAVCRPRPLRRCDEGGCRRRLRVAVADPGRHHSRAAGRPRRARPGADRHRQDRRVRAAGAVQRRPQPTQAAGAGAGPDPRAGHPGRRGVPEICRSHSRLPRAAGLRRPALRAAAERAQARRACGGRHSRPGDRSPGSRHAGPVPAQDAGAGRSRRNAAHGLHRRRRSGAEEVAGETPGGAVLGNHAAGDPPHRADLSERPGRSHHRGQDHHLGQYPPALLVGERPAQAGRADPHPGSRAVRRHDHLRPHQGRHRRAGAEAAGTRHGRGGHQRRHAAGRPREDHCPAQGRQARHPGRHRRGRARPGRGARQPCAELRHPVRHRKLRAPHRPYRPCRPQWRRDPVRHPAREGHAAFDRARHPPADRRDAAAERGCGQRHPRGTVHDPHHRDPGRRPDRDVSRSAAALREREQRAGDRYRRGDGQAAAG